MAIASGPNLKGVGCSAQLTRFGISRLSMIGSLLQCVKSQLRGHKGGFLLPFVLQGEMGLSGKALEEHRLKANDSVVIPNGAAFTIDVPAGAELLETSLPANLPGR